MAHVDKQAMLCEQNYKIMLRAPWLQLLRCDDFTVFMAPGAASSPNTA